MFFLTGYSLGVRFSKKLEAYLRVRSCNIQAQLLVSRERCRMFFVPVKIQICSPNSGDCLDAVLFCKKDLLNEREEERGFEA